MQFSNFGELLIVGFTNGEIRLMMIEHPKNYCSIKQHDAHNGAIAAAYLNFNEQFLISAGARILPMVWSTTMLLTSI